MTSVLNVDTIADKAGTGPVALTKQSAAKCFAQYDQSSGLTLNDSLNVSSTSDDDTGDSTHNWTNNYSTSTYALGGMGGHDAGTRVLTTTAKSASSISVALSNSSQAGIDENDVSYIGHGDLA